MKTFGYRVELRSLVAALVALSAVPGCVASPADTETTGTTSSALSLFPPREDEAIRLAMTVAGRSQTLTVSARGSIAMLSGADGAPTIEAAVDYASDEVLVEDLSHQTYSTLPLKAYVAQQQVTLTAPGATSASGGTQTTAAQALKRTRLRTIIAGLSARAYLATGTSGTVRVWYADDLPLPPLKARLELAKLGQAGGATGDPGPANADRCDDRHDSRNDERDCDCGVATAIEVAGRTVLRIETQDASGQWTIMTDTTQATRARLSASDFAVPSGWTAAPLPSVPPTVSPAFDSISMCTPDDDPTTTVGFFGGALMSRTQVYVAYFGPDFIAAHNADPAGFDSVFTAGISQALGGQYYAGLQEYGVVGTPNIASTQFYEITPAGAHSDFFVDVGGVLTLENAGAVPDIWWIDTPAPLVALVYDDQYASPGSGAGYHLAAPSLIWGYLFPFSLAALPLVPYVSVVVPHAALSVTAPMLAARDSNQLCGGSCSPSAPCVNNCPAIYALDQGTITMSHEMVEAMTDPFPFSGWSNPNLVPEYYDGEIADICQLSCPDTRSPNRWTRQGNTVLATYYSNTYGICTPGWLPGVTINEPVAGSDVPCVCEIGSMMPDGSCNACEVSVQATIVDAVTQGVLAASNLNWTVDGNAVGGAGPSVIPVPSGHHTLRALFVDPETLVGADAVITVNLVLPQPLNTNCSVGLGACQAFGSLDASGNCNAVAGTPDFNFHDGYAANQSSDWDCNGVTEQQFPVTATGLPLNCGTVFDGGFCGAIGDNEAVCNQGNANNVGDFYLPCEPVDIHCGEPLLHQQCFYSASHHTCLPGANEDVFLGCR